MRREVLFLILLCAALFSQVSANTVTYVEPEYEPAGLLVAGKEVTFYQEIFVGDYFAKDYTLEFHTDLTEPQWEIQLITAGGIAKIWDFSYQSPKIDGFTISMPEYETKLLTKVTGTPASYDAGKEITLWEMKVVLGNGGTKEVFRTNPVMVHAWAPVQTASRVETPVLETTVPTTVQTTATKVPVETAVTTSLPKPETEPAKSLSSPWLCLAAVAAAWLHRNSNLLMSLRLIANHLPLRTRVKT